MEFKNVLLTIVFCFCVLVFIVLVGFSVYTLFAILSPAWGAAGGCGFGGCSSDVPSISGNCSKFKDNYEMAINISNYKKEMRDVKCELSSKGGMVSDKDEISLPFISVNSSDICSFVLTGEPTSSVRARVSYTLKGFWGGKKYSTMVEPYTQCLYSGDEAAIKYGLE